MFHSDYYGQRAIRMTKRVVHGDTIKSIAQDEGIGEERTRDVIAKFNRYLFPITQRVNPKSLRSKKEEVVAAVNSWASNRGLDPIKISDSEY